MALDCGTKCMKILLFIFNGIFFLAGAAMLGLGIWLKVDKSISDRFTEIAGDDTLFHAASIVMIVVGCLILIIGFFGCCGACQDNQCLLCTFVVCLSIIFILEITIAILAAVFRNEISDGLENEMSKQAAHNVHPMMKTNNTALSLAWHHMQYDFHCCGGRNFSDYLENPYFNEMVPMPKTCCVLNNDDPEDPKPVDYATCKKEFNSGTPKLQLFEAGCYDGFVDWLEGKSAILIGVAVGIAVIQILGITFACCVRRALSGQKEYV